MWHRQLLARQMRVPRKTSHGLDQRLQDVAETDLAIRKSLEQYGKIALDLVEPHFLTIVDSP